MLAGFRRPRPAAVACPSGRTGLRFRKGVWRDGEEKRAERTFHAGRFEERLPDPAVADGRSSQDWNPYSYVANRPMSQVDPTGAVRAGPGCNVNGLFCLDAGGGPSAGGGFTEQAIQAQSLTFSIRWRVFWTPVIQIFPTFVFGEFRFRCRVSHLPIFYLVVAAALQQVDAQAVADRQPADEPILLPGEAAPTGAGTRRRTRFVRSRIGFTSSMYETGRHEYRLRGFICQRSPQYCNEALANAVFEHVNQNDIPFTDDDLAVRRHTLPSNNPIDHRENESARTIINRTREGHVFHPGTVEHKVHFGNGGGTLYYDVTGEGTGRFPSVNNELGRLLFEPGVREILRRYAR